MILQFYELVCIVSWGLNHLLDVLVHYSFALFPLCTKFEKNENFWVIFFQFFFKLASWNGMATSGQI